MNTLIKAQLLLCSAALIGSLAAQPVYINFNTLPTWSSFSYSGADANWTNPTGGVGGGSNKFLQSSFMTSGDGVKVKVIKVPAWTQIEVSGYMAAPATFSPYQMDFSYKMGSYTAANFLSNPNSWTSIQTFSDIGVNGNGNSWTHYGVVFNSGADTQVSVALGFMSAYGLQVGYDDLAIFPVTMLPVELLYFEAEKTNEEMQLNWETASENNNDHFDVERSSDAVHFEKISSIPGHGNSQVRLNYTYTDNSFNNAGIYYYRLKQTDYNGTFSYSHIAYSKSEKVVANKLKAYPNPFSDALKYEYKANTPGSTTIKIQDISGKLIYSQIQSNIKQEESVSMQNLPHGVYILSADDGISPVERVILAH